MATILSGCAAEMLVLPIVVMAAPIVLPIDAAQINATVTQPVTVVSASGQVLAAPPPGSTAKQTRYTTSRNNTVRCTGRSKSGPPRASSARLDMTCSNGMRGRLTIKDNMTVGASVFLDVEGSRAKGMLCNGNYRPKGKTAGPFLIKCEHTVQDWADFTKTKKTRTTTSVHQAAVSAGATAAGAFRVTVWVPGS